MNESNNEHLSRIIPHLANLRRPTPLAKRLSSSYDWLRFGAENGKVIACGGIFPSSEIKAGQQWQGSSGLIVKVDKVNYHPRGSVYYSWKEGGEVKYHSKEHFAFQCRYCLVIGDYH